MESIAAPRHAHGCRWLHRYVRCTSRASCSTLPRLAPCRWRRSARLPRCRVRPRGPSSRCLPSRCLSARSSCSRSSRWWRGRCCRCWAACRWCGTAASCSSRRCCSPATAARTCSRAGWSPRCGCWCMPGSPVLPLAFVRLGVDAASAAQATHAPLSWLLVALLTSVGPSFLVLAVSASVLQATFASTGHESARDPYFLYAASNAGSLPALVAYPDGDRTAARPEPAGAGLDARLRRLRPARARLRRGRRGSRWTAAARSRRWRRCRRRRRRPLPSRSRGGSARAGACWPRCRRA